MALRFITLFLILITATNLHAQELVTNHDFSSGDESWEARTPDGSVSEVSGEWGDGLFFDLANGGGTNSWDVQMTQEGINLRPGYTYKITFGGVAENGNKQILVGIGESGGAYTSYIETDGTLSGTYQEFEASWENADVTDSNARLFLNGGGSDESFTISLLSIVETKTPGSGPNDEVVLINQVGYYSQGPKFGVVRNGSGGTYELRSEGAEAWSGETGEALPYDPADETARILDFSEVEQPGTYTFYKDGNPVSREFSISDTPMKEISKAALRAYYYQRASIELTEEYAGSYARSAGHPDDNVIVHSSAGSGTISSPKGWYDAGDYGKYVVNSGISTYTLMLLYTHFPDYMGSLSLGIPESGNSIPDILDEARWNIDWMLTMQDEDGGVYHKLTPLDFDEDVMPHECTSERYVYMKTTAATLNFAAVMAKAARVYAEYDETFAQSCLDAAEAAFAWAQLNPEVYYVQPDEVNTGEYKDSLVTDEFFWAAAELKAATENSDYDSYLPAGKDQFPPMPVPDWQWTGALGLLTIMSETEKFDSTLSDLSHERLISLADTLVTNQDCGYKVAMTADYFVWGSNSMAANQGVILLHAYYLTGEKEYLDAAVSQIDYLLGRNPLNISYVTGFGQRSPLNPHHRIFLADGIAAPIPGFLVGGPHTGGQDIFEWGCTENYVEHEATSFIDDYCSFATNEITINWNASFSYLSNALEAVFSGEKASGFPEPTNPILYRSRRNSGSFSGISVFELAGGSKLKLTFDLPQNSCDRYEISLFSLTGRNVLNASVPGNESSYTISSAKLGKGTFILRVSNGMRKFSEKIMLR
ncbi:MAG: glycoside hydrolase family 9 protein [Chitinispirillaceae bacterium]